MALLLSQPVSEEASSEGTQPTEAVAPADTPPVSGEVVESPLLVSDATTASEGSPRGEPRVLLTP